MRETLRAVGKKARARRVELLLPPPTPSSTLCSRCALASGSAAQLSSDDESCSLLAGRGCEPAALEEPCQQRWTAHSPQCGAAARTAEQNRESVQTVVPGHSAWLMLEQALDSVRT